MQNRGICKDYKN